MADASDFLIAQIAAKLRDRPPSNALNAWSWRENMNVPQPSGLLQPGPEPTGTQRVADALRPMLPQGHVYDRMTAGISPVAAAFSTDMYDAGKRFAQTGQPAELAMALMPGMRPTGAAAKVAGEAAKDLAKGIRAYHGSPHDFEKFSLDKIGTGEGAQAYGHGLYFAENEGVARSYRDQLSDYSSAWAWSGKAQPTPEQAAMVERLKQPNPYTGEPMTLDALDLDYYKAGVSARRMLSSEYTPDSARAGLQQTIEKSQKAREVLKTLRGNVEFKDPGHMYEVNINAHPDDFLDWDKPLSQQSEKVRKAIEAGVGDKANDPIFRRMFLESGKGEGLMGALAGAKYDKAAAANKLREAGIPGVRYLDQGSRGAGEGSRNYAVWDDSIIQILRKYGLFPFAAGGAAASLPPSNADASP